MHGRVGYDYRYRLSMEDEILSPYECSLSDGRRRFLFEVKTNFIVKKRPDEGGAEEIIDSERFEACVVETRRSDINYYFDLRFSVGCRLKEYLMSDDEVDRLIEDAMDAADQLADYPENADLRVIPVAVSLDVCTVQKEDESFDATMNRAIRPQNLMPLHIWHRPKRNRTNIDQELERYLRNLPTRGLC